MPKRRKTAKKSATKTIVRASRPIVIRQTTGVAKRVRRYARRAGGLALSAGKGLLSSERIGAIVGGYLLGVLDAKGTKLPTVPVLGRAGTCGVALYYLGKHFHQPVVSHAATGFLSIAAYEMGKSGTIAGDSVVGVDTI